MPMPKDFLNPKSMITPGVAGAITMLITNTLHAQFQLPANWTGLAISFLFGLIVFSATDVAILERAAFWIINSLIIFSVALGSNAAGAAAGRPVHTFSTATYFFHPWIRG